MPRQFSGPALRHARLAAGLSPERLAVDVDPVSVVDPEL